MNFKSESISETSAVYKMQSNTIVIQVAFVGIIDPKIKPYDVPKHKTGTPELAIQMRLDGAPTNKGDSDADWYTVTTLREPKTFRLNVPTGTELRAVLSGNITRKEVVLWSIEG